MLLSEAGEGPFEGRLLASAACEVCACKRHCPDLPRDADGRWMNIRENLMKLDRKWWTLRNNDKNWWTLRRATDYTPSQFKLSEVMLRSGSPGVHSCDSLLYPGCNGGFARDAAESWLLAPQQNDRLKKKPMELAVSGHTKHSGT